MSPTFVSDLGHYLKQVLKASWLMFMHQTFIHHVSLLMDSTVNKIMVFYFFHTAAENPKL